MKQGQNKSTEPDSRIRLETSVGTLVFEAKHNAVCAIRLAGEMDAAVSALLANE